LEKKEQRLRGSARAADARSDMWAFGVVLYEMLTGKPAFEGETIMEILGGVMKADPDWMALPPTTPQLIRSLLHRLQKDRNRRLHDIDDARIEIEEGLHFLRTTARLLNS
jgi:serine/threonine protein kinase